MSKISDLIKKLNVVNSLISGLIVAIPAVSFFVDYSPPLFKPAGIIVSCLVVVFLYFGFISKTKNADKIKSKIKWYLLTSVTLIIIYILLMNTTTVYISNKKGSERYQIGWSIKKWSLTPDGINLLNSPMCKAKTAKELLLCATVDKISHVWMDTYIVLFGVLNIIIFLVICLLWSYGWGLFIKLT